MVFSTLIYAGDKVVDACRSGSWRGGGCDVGESLRNGSGLGDYLDILGLLAECWERDGDFGLEIGLAHGGCLRSLSTCQNASHRHSS